MGGLLRINENDDHQIENQLTEALHRVCAERVQKLGISVATTMS